MSLKTLIVALSAALVFTAATAAQAQTPTSTPAPVMPLSPSPQLMPVMPPQTQAGVPLINAQETSLPPTLVDSKATSAVMLLDRIQTLVESALTQTPAAKTDQTHWKKLAGSGTVTIDRSELDEIQSLAAQVAAMFPPRPQP